MPYFIPLEIYRDERYALSPTNSLFQLVQERKQNTVNVLLHPSDLYIAILRYKYNHDQRSLIWVALYIVLEQVDLEEAQKVCSNMFVNFLYPSWDCKDFFTELAALPPSAFHDALPKFPI